MENLSNVNLTSDEVQLCGFRVDGDFYAISVLEVQEVIRRQPLTNIPCAPKFITGLINLRGQIVTSFSLRSLFGLDHNYKENYMNIIVKSGDSLYALMVDEILDVLHVDQSTFEKTPDSLNDKIRNYISGVYKLDGKLLSTLDLNKLLVQELE